MAVIKRKYYTFKKENLREKAQSCHTPKAIYLVSETIVC